MELNNVASVRVFLLVSPVILLQAGESQKPILLPLPLRVPAPDDNPATAEKVALGKQLFFDLRLSGENKMSCATCHLPEKAFGDGLTRPKGHGGKLLSRNIQTVWNVSFLSSYSWDGRVSTREAQALIPIQSADEMHQTLGRERC